MQRKRSELKSAAKFGLQGKYGTALLVVALATIIQNLLVLVRTVLMQWLPAFSVFSLFSNRMLLDQPDSWLETFQNIAQAVVANAPLYLTFFVAGTLLELLFVILVSNVLYCGVTRWFLRADYPQWTPTVGMMFTTFSPGQYKPVVLGMLWKQFWLFLWSLPQVILTFLTAAPAFLLLYHALLSNSAVTPGFLTRVAKLYGLPEWVFQPAWFIAVGALSIVFGIVWINRSYRYSMTEMILADNPSVGARRALELSKKMTRGSVWRLFFLDLSFIGWALLCLLLTVIAWLGFLLLAPYYRATWVEAYRDLRDAAVRRGDVTMEELGYRRFDAPPDDGAAFAR